MRSPCCLCVCVSHPHQLLNARTNLHETWYVLYIMATEPISAVYVINSSHQSVCLYVNSDNVARQRLDKNVTAATNTRATIEELLEALFSLRSVSRHGKVGNYFLF
jgi:hypothetical protein